MGQAWSDDSISEISAIIVGSEFGANNMKTYILYFIVSPVQTGGGVMVWIIFSWHTSVPFVPREHCLNTIDYLNIVADHHVPIF